jgi:hypothetical protein
LHIAGKDEKVGGLFDEIEDLLFGFGFGVACDGDVVKRNAVTVGVILGVRMVRDDEWDVYVEFTASLAIEEVDEAVVVFRNEESCAQRDAAGVKSPSGVDRLGERAPVGLKFVGGNASILQGELDAHEEKTALGIGAVLVRGGDVAVVLCDELGYFGDDAAFVRALDE